MKKYYVEINSDGYIDSWSTVKSNDSMILVEAEESLFGILGCVKYNNGNLVLDAEKREELIKKNNQLSETELLKKENEELKAQMNQTKEDVTNTQIALTEVFELIENLV